MFLRMCVRNLMLFFYNETATTGIYTLSLHAALPIRHRARRMPGVGRVPGHGGPPAVACRGGRSEEHTSDLQSQFHLVCRLLLEKKKKKILTYHQNKKKTELKEQQQDKKTA